MTKVKKARNAANKNNQTRVEADLVTVKKEGGPQTLQEKLNIKCLATFCKNCRLLGYTVVYRNEPFNLKEFACCKCFEGTIVPAKISPPE